MSMQERMEQMRVQDPERYERIMAEREKWKQAQEAKAEKRDSYLAGLDRGRLSNEQQQTVADYENLLKAQEQLRSSMEENHGGRESFMALMQNQRSLQNLSTQVQDILIEQYAESLSNGNRATIAEEIRNILNSTSTNMWGAMPGRGPCRR